MRRALGATGTALALALAAVMAPACGDDPQKGEDMLADSFVGEQASVQAKANEMAELSVGAAKLKVPAGALDSDTTLTVQVVSKKDKPASKDVALDVYDFGPNGLTFKAEVELEFDVTQVSVPKSKHVDVAVLDEKSGSWQVIPPTPDPKPGKISAKIAHFSLYTVILSENTGQGPVTGQCGADFVPCGGDLVGTWNFKTGCISAPPASLGVTFPAQSFDACTMKPGAAVAIGVAGTVSFGSDGTYSADQTVTLNPSIQIANTCLDELTAAEGKPVTCADFAGTTQGDICVSTLPPETQPKTGTGTYTTNGNQLTQMENGGATPAANEVTSYCVSGNTLTIRIERPSEQRVDVYVAERM